MRPIYVKIVFDRKKKAGLKMKGSIEIRLSQDRRTLYYSTGIRVLRKHWHDGQIVHRVDAAELQQSLDLIVRKIRRTINEMNEAGGCSLDMLMSRLREKEKEDDSFLDFCQQRAQIRSYGKSVDSQKRYERFLSFLVNWGKIEHFTDVTDKNVMQMDEYLSATGMKPYSKWNNYHRFLNSFILDAIDAGFLTRNPYRWLRIEKNMSSGGLGKYLTMEELEKIRKIELPTESIRRVRDIFVFQTYTCLSYADLKAFDASAIRYIQGHPVYTSKRGKTKQEFTFLILSPAMDILQKYNNRLPIISNVKYNEFLKVLALMAGIDKPISSHWARHTGATMLLNEGGMDMETVAKVLGHSSTKITRQIYAKLLDDTVVKAMTVAQEKIEGQ